MGRDSNPMQSMCRSGCGFYGNPATDARTLYTRRFNEGLTAADIPAFHESATSGEGDCSSSVPSRYHVIFGDISKTSANLKNVIGSRRIAERQRESYAESDEGDKSQLNDSHATPPSSIESKARDLANTDVISYFSSHESLVAAQPENLTNNNLTSSPVKEHMVQDQRTSTINAIQILLKELKVQHSNVSKRLEELQSILKEQQKHVEQQRFHNVELQHELVQTRGINEDQITHLNELKQRKENSCDWYLS
ncbi:hypothetical protein GQX74_010770 [Glossina fuscipes]|nr:hypothetical protein GQX74_010770 [Glossina fuscipes]